MTDGDRTIAPTRLAPLVALAAGIVALAAAGIVGGLLEGAHFFEAYLLAFVWWAGVPLGGMAILMVHHLTGGRWGWSIRSPLEACAATLPLVALMVIPVLLGLDHVYSWATKHVHTGKPIIPFKHMYLGEWAFIGRSAFYVIVWAVMGVLLHRFSVREDEQGDSPASLWAQRLSAGGLVVYVLTASFAFFDWIATLAPHWFSTIFGMYVIIGQALAALSLIIVLTAGGLPGIRPMAWDRDSDGARGSDRRRHGQAPRTSLAHATRRGGEAGDAPDLLDAEHLNDLGNLMLMLVVLWAYMAFSQFFIIWNGNLPEEITWYIDRTHGVWRYVSIALIFVHFLLPFSALLFKRVKRSPRPLLAVAGLVLAAQITDIVWMVMPAFDHVGILTSLTAALTMAGLGGVWLGAFFWMWRRHPISVRRAHLMEAQEA